LATLRLLWVAYFFENLYVGAIVENKENLISYVGSKLLKILETNNLSDESEKEVIKDLESLFNYIAQD